ncbi:MAG: hypothetical protein ACOYJE_03700 [Bacteroidaceae bacterium]|jgi:hypothetical protein
MQNLTTDILYFRPSLPFHPSEKQILYVEEQFNPEVNKYLLNHYEELCTHFEQVGYEFCYFPYLSRKLSEKEYVRYFTPYQSRPVRPMLESSCLSPFLKRGYHLSPSLLIYHPKLSRKGYYAFRAVKIYGQETELGSTMNAILLYLAQQKDEYDHILYCNSPLIETLSDPEDYADMHFSEEVTTLMKDVREKIECLRQHGVNEMILRSLLNPQVKLSRLYITPNARILLSDYGDLEIKMSPLVKSVFFLFLRHPEGIAFKYLSDYRTELYEIYNHLTGRQSNEAIKQSIADVTDPCKNSINEKCARIREAFIREFDEHLAQYYYVTGNRGQAKSIKLPRTLVEWKLTDK